MTALDTETVHNNLTGTTQKNPRAGLLLTDRRGLRQLGRSSGSIIVVKQFLEPVVDKASENVRYDHLYDVEESVHFNHPLSV